MANTNTLIGILVDYKLSAACMAESIRTLEKEKNELKEKLKEAEEKCQTTERLMERLVQNLAPMRDLQDEILKEVRTIRTIADKTSSVMDKPMRLPFGYNKNITVKKNGHYLNVYINDNVFENGNLIKEKSKFVWLKWEEAIRLRSAITTLEENLLKFGEISKEEEDSEEEEEENNVTFAKKSTTHTTAKKQEISAGKEDSGEDEYDEEIKVVKKSAKKNAKRKANTAGVKRY